MLTPEDFSRLVRAFEETYNRGVGVTPIRKTEIAQAEIQEGVRRTFEATDTDGRYVRLVLAWLPAVEANLSVPQAVGVCDATPALSPIGCGRLMLPPSYLPRCLCWRLLATSRAVSLLTDLRAQRVSPHARSGEIDAEELRAALEELGMVTTPEQAAMVLKKYDVDGGGTLDLFEFDRLIRDIRTAQEGSLSESSTRPASNEG